MAKRFLPSEVSFEGQNFEFHVGLYYITRSKTYLHILGLTIKSCQNVLILVWEYLMGTLTFLLKFLPSSSSQPYITYTPFTFSKISKKAEETKVVIFPN